MAHLRAVQTILTDATGSATGKSYTMRTAGMGQTDTTKFMATVAGTGAVTATVPIEYSLDGTYWATGATITLSGTTSATDGYATVADWPFCRAKTTAISGTNATVTVKMS
jgi:hypothetical protein